MALTCRSVPCHPAQCLHGYKVQACIQTHTKSAHCKIGAGKPQIHAYLQLALSVWWR